MCKEAIWRRSTPTLKTPAVVIEQQRSSSAVGEDVADESVLTAMTSRLQPRARHQLFTLSTILLVVALVACNASDPLPDTRIVSFEATRSSAIRGESVVLSWVVEGAGRMADVPSCSLSARADGEAAEDPVPVDCSMGTTVVVGAPAASRYVRYQLNVLKRRVLDPADSYVTRSLTIDLESVTLEPHLTTLIPNGSQLLTAEVANASGPGLTWDASCGTIMGSGHTVRFTAPATRTSCAVTATSQSDPGAYSSTQIDVIPAASSYLAHAMSDAGAVTRSVSTMPDGTAVIGGHFEGRLTFDAMELTSAGGRDVLVAKADMDGGWLWAAQARSEENARAIAVAATADGGAIVVGDFFGTATFGTASLTSAGSTDAFIARVSGDGSWLWAVRAGGMDGASASGLTVLPDGSTIVVGSFRATAAFGDVELTAVLDPDAFVARIDANGRWLWVTSGGGPARTWLTSVDQVDGGFVVAGYAIGSPSFGGIGLPRMGGSDILVAKISTDGEWVWANGAGSTGFDYAESVAARPDGGAFVSGRFRETMTIGESTLQATAYADLFIASVDSGGTWEWAIRAGNEEESSAPAIRAAGNTGAVVTAFFTGNLTVGETTFMSEATNAFVGRLGGEGEWTWLTQLRSDEGVYGWGLDLLDDGSVIVTGMLRGTSAFGPDVIGGAGESGIFLTKLKPDGSW